MARKQDDGEGLFADRGTRFGWLRAAVANLDDVPRCRRADLKQLVEQYEVKTTAEGYCYLTREQLFESLHWGRTKFDLVRRLAEALGWIEVSRDSGRAGGQGPNRVRVAWERIRLGARPNRVPQNGRRLPRNGKRLPQNGTPTNKEFIPLTSPPNKSSSGDEALSSDPWKEIAPPDLKSPRKVDRLYRIAVRRYGVPDSEVDRRGFHGAARQALGGENPGGLFVDLVKRRAWRRPASELGAVSDGAADKAAELLKLEERGPPRPRASDLGRGPPAKSREEQERELRARYGLDSQPRPKPGRAVESVPR